MEARDAPRVVAWCARSAAPTVGAGSLAAVGLRSAAELRPWAGTASEAWLAVLELLVGRLTGGL